MRADRLLSILLILQRRKKVTAAQLAREMEVSVRTIYRDLDALGMAGIPVIAGRGAGGGCSLLESFHADLSGMTPEEACALLQLALPEPLAGLPAGNMLKSALRKLEAALPQGDARRPARLILDWNQWQQAENPPVLQALYTAVMEQMRTRLDYRYQGWIPMTQEVAPLGLVGKAGEWYLVFDAGGRWHTLRLADLERVEVLEECFEYPDEFQLAQHWQAERREVERGLASFHIIIKISPRLFPFLEGRYSLKKGKAQGQAGEEIAELKFESFEAARQAVLAWGGGVEVLEPQALRLSVQDYARQTLQVYQSGE